VLIAWLDDDDVRQSDVAQGRNMIAYYSSFARWKPTPVPDEDCFASIKAGIDALPPGAKMLLNSGASSYISVPHISLLAY
jgi:hypothetical protein